jgi:uncharacterized membrane protein
VRDEERARPGVEEGAGDARERLGAGCSPRRGVARRQDHPVGVNAAVKLITTATAEMARDASVGRAEAMRRATLALIARGRPEEAHPAYWAPFVVVGEGAAGR